ncbi:hypothetical protein AMST5_03894 [freshwater sediment metagenome]|uniref:Uncharacterized protein n=1 Tax=freshwater sediment metagenome TaxID=556182 RepID=A0AA48RF39_9ZZZZ
MVAPQATHAFEAPGKLKRVQAGSGEFRFAFPDIGELLLIVKAKHRSRLRATIINDGLAETSMTVSQDSLSDSRTLCTSCGICCKGYVFNYGSIEKEELEPLAATSVNVYRHADDFNFSLPCPALAENRCTVYASRPKTCAEFQCTLLKKLTRKQIALDAAMGIVDQFRQVLRQLQQDDLYREISSSSILTSRNLDEINKLILKTDDPLLRKRYGKTSLLLHLAQRLISAHFGHEINPLFDKEEAAETLNSFRPQRRAEPTGKAPEPDQVTLRDALDTKFWQSLAPDFNVCSPPSFKEIEQCDFTERKLEEARHRLTIEGYFQARCKWMADSDRMAEFAGQLSHMGLPSVFAFVYDEFWLPTLQLHPLLRSLLSEDYVMLPDFWVWNVDPAKGGAGWKPHRDKGRVSLNEDGSPKSLTVWIPLTEATPLNGCMYIVPAHLDPTYNTERENSRQFDYASIRALPAGPGDFLVWNQAVFHWGGKSSPAATDPRISMALEFQRADVPAFNTPLIPPLSPPPFEARLRLIAKQILQYQHMYQLDGKMLKLAQELEREFTPAES